MHDHLAELISERETRYTRVHTRGASRRERQGGVCSLLALPPKCRNPSRFAASARSICRYKTDIRVTTSRRSRGVASRERPEAAAPSGCPPRSSTFRADCFVAAGRSAAKNLRGRREYFAILIPSRARTRWRCRGMIVSLESLSLFECSVLSPSLSLFLRRETSA